MWHWPRAVTWNTEQHTNHRKETFSRKLCVENREDWAVRNFANSISWPGDNTSLDTDTTCSWTDDLDCKTAFEIFAKEEKKPLFFLFLFLTMLNSSVPPTPPPPALKGGTYSEALVHLSCDPTTAVYWLLLRSIQTNTGGPFRGPYLLPVPHFPAEGLLSWIFLPETLERSLLSVEEGCTMCSLHLENQRPCLTIVILCIS